MEIKFIGGPRDGQVLIRAVCPKMMVCATEAKEQGMYGLYLIDNSGENLVWSPVPPPAHLLKDPGLDPR